MSDTDTDEHTIDAAIAAYRDELTAEAALADRDLAEIEDHMRELIDELRATMPLAAAIASARRRFGDPRPVAREHARVHTPFGARLSRARAWSAVALLLPFGLLHGSRALFLIPHPSPWLQLIVVLGAALHVGMCGALMARLSWARAFVFGALPLSIAWQIAVVAWLPGGVLLPLELAAMVGALALLAPWRRGELTLAGAGLALMAPVYIGAFHLYSEFRPDLITPGFGFGPLALAAALAGGAGAMLRARWAAPATLLVAPLALIGMHHTLADLYPDAGPPLFATLTTTTYALAAVCALLAAAVQWRLATSALGTLRSLR